MLFCLVDRIWLREYQSLEKQGCLRHIRVSNDGDKVCVVPHIPFGYKQTGVNIHLYPDKEAEVDYDSTRSRLSAVQCTDKDAMHTLEVYYERLVGNYGNRRIMKYSVEEFYREYANARNTVNAIIDEYNDYGFIKDNHVAEMYRDFLSSAKFTK